MLFEKYYKKEKKLGKELLYFESRIEKEKKKGSSHHDPAETNLTRIHEDSGLIPDLAQWDKDLELL